MKKQILLFVGFIFIFTNVVSAQKKTVTNADLEKFRQRRVQSEKEYRENYQRLGLPSPEELEKRREQDGKALAELSERLRKERLEREEKQRDEEYRRAQYELFLRTYGSQYNQGAYNGNGYYPLGYLGAYSYYGYSNGHYNNRFGNRRGFGRGGNFYNPIIPGTVFPQQGVRINTGGVRIGITGGSRPPSTIRNPR
jgi:hypothetical protein